MKYRYDPSVRNYEQPNGGQGQGLQHERQRQNPNQSQSPFPGIPDPFQSINKSVGLNKSIGLSKTPVPFSSGDFSNGVTPSITIQPASGQQIIPLPESDGNLPNVTVIEPAAKSDSKGGFNLANSLNDLKGVVDRLGGIDGIVTTMAKVQKVVGSITQMAPLIKVLATSLKPEKKGAIANDDDDAPKRRKRKRTGSAKGKGAGVTPGGQRKRKRKPTRPILPPE
ncbi:hypothetical protein [Paenibacillus montanisoli]|uniref:Tyrosine protein kinase n=1 Tax=Paenibacillus montanisoli TaxID=2081970 RepID=A0A328U340_9BACL|nr:hypothetical protein [Paenibacillus montanisoli]RAP74394.1 hypothetical protein DL346_20140 [Paenibacillus montanisoli]